VQTARLSIHWLPVPFTLSTEQIAREADINPLRR
jgi:hypothetical protein